MDRRAFVRTSLGAVALNALDVDQSDGGIASKSGATSNLSSALATVNLDHVINDYVAVWNEHDPTVRHRRIRSAWTEDGITCYEA